MFYDRFVALCKEQGIAQSKAVQIIGLNRSAITKWKTGSTPNGETVKKLADLFGVTADYLLGNVNEPYFYLDNQRIVDEINNLDEYEKKPSQEAGPENDYQERMLLLARKAVDIPKEQRDKIIKTFEDTIDLYLDAQGLKKKEDT